VIESVESCEKESLVSVENWHAKVFQAFAAMELISSLRKPPDGAASG
jgi:hypothetical protein